jgi:UDP-N-acetylmuramoylalanine--D-glutamate ligase
MTGPAGPVQGSDWGRTRVVVTGLGVSGTAAARALVGRAAAVVLVEGRAGPAQQRRAADLRALGVEVRLGEEATGSLPPGTDLVVTSPGWRPDQPLLRSAAAAGVPVWGDVELAWRLRDPAVPWLGVTGTNGKTTTVRMVAAMLAAAGYRTVAAGNVGLSVVDAVLASPRYDVVAVELSSYQLHWSHTVACHAAAVLNVAPDHVDWHGSLRAYAEAKRRIWAAATVAVYNADDAPARDLAADRPTAVSFTLQPPGPGQLGVADGALVDNAWTADDAGPGPQVLARVDDVRPPAPHNVANALAAAALARSLGADPRFAVPARAVHDGLGAFTPDPHRIAHVATVAGVDYVDDSKATNPHAAAASLRSYPSVVWVAGGLAKGARFEELVADAAARLRGVVLLGRDRPVVAEALARHAPDVPVVEVAATETGAMEDVVRAAAGLARPGDTVLLAPGCASMDMFTDYAERGELFAAAVRQLSR